MRHEVRFSDEADEHIAALTARERTKIFDSIGRQLVHEPTVASRHRKRMDPNRPGFVAPWELRIAEMRVYYDVEELPKPVVIVVAVGKKTRSRVRIGDKEYEP